MFAKQARYDSVISGMNLCHVIDLRSSFKAKSFQSNNTDRFYLRWDKFSTCENACINEMSQGALATMD